MNRHNADGSRGQGRDASESDWPTVPLPQQPDESPHERITTPDLRLPDENPLRQVAAGFRKLWHTVVEFVTRAS